jgi:hypothetical protein
MPSASFSHTVSLSIDADTAWGKLQEEATWAGIGPIDSVSNAVHDDAGELLSFQWAANVGGKLYRGTADTVEADKPNRFVLKMNTSEIAGNVVTELTPSGDASDVSVEITLTTKGMLSAMFFPAIKQALSSGFPQQVEDLAATL